ncbi:MAG: hypothetical protein U1E81_13740 [Xanthobacteraceae bacterium]
MSVEKTARGRRLYKRRTTMEILNTSLSMVKRLENCGKLRKVRLGERDVYHVADDVDTLLKQQTGE